MFNKLLGHVHFGSALYSLSFSSFHYIIIYFSEWIWFLMFILALHKNRILILLIHGCSFGLVCLHLLTLSKPRRTRRCLLCLRRNRSVVLFCSGTMLQGHWFPKAGSLFWHADSFKLCLTEQPRAINHLTSMWNDAVSQTEEREKDLSHVCSSYPIRQPWNCYHAHDSVFSPRNKNLLHTEELDFSLRQGSGHSLAVTCIVTH